MPTRSFKVIKSISGTINENKQFQIGIIRTDMYPINIAQEKKH